MPFVRGHRPLMTTLITLRAISRSLISGGAAKSTVKKYGRVNSAFNRPASIPPSISQEREAAPLRAAKSALISAEILVHANLSRIKSNRNG
jgi:hypothetical protein